jgi:hypothetical protein
MKWWFLGMIRRWICRRFGHKAREERVYFMTTYDGEVISRATAMICPRCKDAYAKDWIHDPGDSPLGEGPE